jgi:hypothetical protein
MSLTFFSKNCELFQSRFAVSLFPIAYRPPPETHAYGGSGVRSVAVVCSC